MKNQSILITVLDNSIENLTLLLEGQLVMRNADPIQKELLTALQGPQNIELVLKNIIKLDLAILQLLIGLQKSAARLGKNLSLDIELTDHVNTVIQNSGLEKLLIPNLKMQLNGVY